MGIPGVEVLREWEYGLGLFFLCIVYVSWCCQHRLRQRGRVTDCLNGGRFLMLGVRCYGTVALSISQMKRALVEQRGS